MSRSRGSKPPIVAADAVTLVPERMPCWWDRSLHELGDHVSAGRAIGNLTIASIAYLMRRLTGPNTPDAERLEIALTMAPKLAMHFRSHVGLVTEPPMVGEATQSTASTVLADYGIDVDDDPDGTRH